MVRFCFLGGKNAWILVELSNMEKKRKKGFKNHEV